MRTIWTLIVAACLTLAAPAPARARPVIRIDMRLENQRSLEAATIAPPRIATAATNGRATSSS